LSVPQRNLQLPGDLKKEVGLELPIEKNPKQRSDLSMHSWAYASPRSNTEEGFSEIDSGSKAEDRKKTSTIPNSGFPVNARTWKAPVGRSCRRASSKNCDLRGHPITPRAWSGYFSLVSCLTFMSSSSFFPPPSTLLDIISLSVTARIRSKS
jgi:hypothetical protein